MIIRRAVPGDEESAAPAVLEFYTELVERNGMPFNAESAKRLMRYFTGNLPGGVAFVAWEGDRIIGFIAGVVLPWSLDVSETIFEELAWFVSKTARKTTAGVRLYRQMEEYCRAVGAKAMTMGSFVASHGSVDAFYGRKGYKEVEKKWLKIL